MKVEKTGSHEILERDQRVIVDNPLPFFYTDNPNEVLGQRPVRSYTGVITEVMSPPHDGYYIIKVDIPLYYISERLERIKQHGQGVSLFYDRPSLDEIK